MSKYIDKGVLTNNTFKYQTARRDLDRAVELFEHGYFPEAAAILLDIGKAIMAMDGDIE